MDIAVASAHAYAQTCITLTPTFYSLDYECPVPWSSAQEDSINQEYPFRSTDVESPEDYVIRRYLETLWLPESIMPLQHLIKSLRRLSSTSGSKALHAMLNPLLLSVRATQEKYHQELPQILHDGGGAGEIEEMVMWYAWNKEKYDEERGEGGDTEEAWKKAWLEKLERREVQIQILLYFQLLSFSPLAPTTPVASPSKKRKRKQTHGPPSPVKAVFPLTLSIEAEVAAKGTKPSATHVDDSLGMEDRLEFFMDKLSLWQLVASLNTTGSSHQAPSQPTEKDQRDWMQTFCEDVVEPL
ncbi:hypothetical protein K439DRAFT_1362758 [Ramaria rubella]|nr:hypothetical protein K439DRAFT_1362758 [Ramaria rubella]